MTRPTLICLNSDGYNSGLCCDQFMGNLDQCNRSCNTLDDHSVRIFNPNKTGDLTEFTFKWIRK